MTDRLAEIRVRLEAATPGPWFATSCPDKHSDDGPDFWLIDAVPSPNQETEVAEICHKPGGKSGHNADFIAHAPEDIAWLLEEVKRLQEELDLA